MAAPHTKVDRQTTTPFLLKLFYCEGAFPPLADFQPLGSSLPSHLQIYTWPTCTLRELSHLLISSIPHLLPSPAIGTRLSFRLIFPDARSSTASAPATAGRFMTKDLGSLVLGDGSEYGEGTLPQDEAAREVVRGGLLDGRVGGDPEITLRDSRFVIGDYVAVAILPPGRDGSVAPMLRERESIDAGRPRRDWDDGNGYGGRGAYGGTSRGRGRGNGFVHGPIGGGFNRGGGVPMGEWRRGEAVPGDGSGFRGGRGGYGGRGRERW